MMAPAARHSSPAGHQDRTVVFLGDVMKKIVYAFVLIAMMVFAPLKAWAVPTISGTYYDESVTVTCNSGVFCSAYFSPTPTNPPYLNVERVSCSINTGTGNIFIGAGLGVSSTSRVAYLSSTPSVSTQYNTHLDINQETKFRIGPGKTPYVYVAVYVSQTTVMNCTIVGTLSTQ
jgi:hypothetical protein